jgi:CO dehydrogenase/acetyl-CoA synthase beta subunit
MAFTALDTTLDRVEALRRSWATDSREARVRPVAELPLAVGPGAGRGVVLRADTWTELGGPATPSVSAVLLTADSGRVVDGRVTVAGPDVAELAGTATPFAQIVLIHSPGLAADDLPALGELHYVRDAIEGYMVRSRELNLWARIERDAVAHGFDFAFLGSALAHIYRTAKPRIVGLELIFATRDAYVAALEPIAAEVATLSRARRSATWARRGIDPDCRVGVHCGACTDSVVCTEIRRVTARRATENATRGA